MGKSRHELSPATEPASVALGPVLGDRLLELLAGKQLQHLAENAGYSYHGGGGPPYDSRLATQTVAEFYPRRSKPNLDKSDQSRSRRTSNLCGSMSFWRSLPVPPLVWFWSDRSHLTIERALRDSGRSCPAHRRKIFLLLQCIRQMSMRSVRGVRALQRFG